MSEKEQNKTIGLWKITTTHERWSAIDNTLIKMSDLIIERIYREYIMRENFKN